jgi:FAD/FMN-containing dehydrogenase
MTPSRRVQALLAGSLAPGEILDAPEALRLAACDTFFEGPPPLAVPGASTATALVAALPRLVAAGLALVPRGAASSYTAGVVPGAATGDWVALDLRRLDCVLEIRDEDALVRVEAGCTWAALDARLAAHGLRTPFRGPASGLHATVGGTLSNDAMFHGSARHGTAADSVLGLVVLLADGRLLRTGVEVLGGTPLPCSHGPDLTGLFVGAGGAFGVVLEATLRAIPRPVATRLAGYRCATRAGALQALRALVRHGDASEALLVDPSVSTRLDGLAPDALEIPGRAFASAAPWLLGVCVDAPSGPEADARLARVEAACRAAGARRDGDGLLGPWLAQPFPPPRMLRGADGRRWVPVHGLVTHARAAAALDVLDATMQRAAPAVAALDLRWSIACAAVGASGVLVEANLDWPATANPVVDHYLGAAAGTVPEAEACRRAAARRARYGTRLDRRRAPAGWPRLRLSRPPRSRGRRRARRAEAPVRSARRPEPRRARPRDVRSRAR